MAWGISADPASVVAGIVVGAAAAVALVSSVGAFGAAARAEGRKTGKKKNGKKKDAAAALQPRGEYKVVMVVNGGLIQGGAKKRLTKEGKMAAQCCHAAVGCVQEASASEA